MACTVRCQRSTSPRKDCRCSCGGTNHGVEASNPAVSGAASGSGPSPGLAGAAGGAGASSGSFPGAGAGGAGGPGGAGGSGGPMGPGFVNLGITPYRPQPEGPDDPRYQRLGDLAGYYETERYREFEARLHREAGAAGLRVAEVRRVVGVWEGEFEPAVSVDLAGDPDEARGLALRLKEQYTQEGVMEFEPDEESEGLLYLLRGVEDRERAAQLMREYGFPGGRFEGDRLEIADRGGGMTEAVARLAVDLGTDLDARAGRISFL